jgi:hypothetical protein
LTPHSSTDEVKGTWHQEWADGRRLGEADCCWRSGSSLLTGGAPQSDATTEAGENAFDSIIHLEDMKWVQITHLEDRGRVAGAVTSWLNITNRLCPASTKLIQGISVKDNRNWVH